MEAENSNPTIVKGTRVMLVKGQFANQFGVIDRHPVFSEFKGKNFKYVYVRVNDGPLVFVPEEYVTFDWLHGKGE